MKKWYWISAIFLLQITEYAWAVPFGSFDPRSLAMGGTGVASAEAGNAVFHNPALLAQYEYYEDEGRTSVFILPTITARVSDTIEEVADFREQDYDSKLSSSITDFNNGVANSAQAVLDASVNLQDGLSRVSSGPVVADGNIAFVIAIPSLKQGGAFMFNKRFVGDGRITKTPEDQAVLDAYVQTMEFLITGQNQPPPDVLAKVIDENGDLIDQTDNLTSSATAAGVALTELGVAMAAQFSVFKQDIAMGITPKFVKAETYATDAGVTEDLDENRDFYNRWDVTADVGFAKMINKTWNVGVSIKNIVPLEYTTNTDRKISLDPQLRAGVAYKTSWGMLAFDLDVLENTAVGGGDKTQYSLFGAEWDFKWGKLRGGYNYNFSASSAVKKGMFSAGIQLSPFGVLLDLAYADNGIERAAALQTGFLF